MKTKPAEEKGAEGAGLNRSGILGEQANPSMLWPAFAPQLSEEEFLHIRRLVHRHAGIHLPHQKKILVQARLAKLLRVKGLDNFREYCRLLREDKSGRELAELLDVITTNQTAFWREPGHFLLLAQDILPAWRRQKWSGLNWRFWSAGCSSGEEPYTLAMVLMEVLPPEDRKKVKIYASDLNTQVLTQARQGIYPEDRIAPLPAEWQKRFFLKGRSRWAGFVRLRPEVRNLVHFFHLNLMDDFDFHEELDLIFCRNVMIYFDRQTQGQVVEKFYRSLKPGGYLFLGHSESLCNFRHRFRYVKPAVYQK